MDLNTLLKDIIQKINTLSEGDLMSLSDIYSLIEDHYHDLKDISGEKSKILVNSLLEVMNQGMKGILNDFSLLNDYLLKGINILQKSLSVSDETSEDEKPDYDTIINELSFLLSYSEEDEFDLNDLKADTEEKIIDIQSPINRAEETNEMMQESKDKSVFEPTEDPELYMNFFAESNDHLDNVEAEILELEQNPLNKKSIDTIFRAFHTIKGVSGFLNMREINFLAHETESLLEHIIQEKIYLEEDYLDTILDHTDLMKELIHSYQAKFQNKDFEIPSIDEQSITQRITELISRKKQYVERKQLGEIILENKDVDEETLNEAFKKLSEDKSKKLGQLLIEEKKLTPKQLAKALRTQRESIKITDTKDNLSELAMIKINANKLDNLLDMVGELVIANNQITQNPTINNNGNTKLNKDVGNLSRIVYDLHKLGMTLRMVEIRQTFQKINRLVRDLSKKQNKPVNLVLTGEETEIDRSIVDQIYEPLVHVIRNAIDHGIETPEERENKGKMASGIINLSAYHQGGNIVIVIEDDGRGINRDRILEKAHLKGIISDKHELSEKEIDNLIFHPGLSTAKEVTDVSGRGIGMDIIKSEVEKLRGKVEVSFVKDMGTKISLKIPLTMAIIDGMVLLIGPNKYVLPTLHVKHIFKMDPNNYSTLENRGEMIQIRGHIVPMVRLYRILNVEPQSDNPEDAIMILVENDNQEKCFMIDQILDKQEIVVKSLGERLGDVQGVSASTILGDGKVGLILDVKGIFDISENTRISISK